MGYDHLSISHFFPFFFPLPPLASSGRSPKFFAYHSSIGSSRLVLLISGIFFTSPDYGLSVEKYKELTLFFSLPNSLQILDSVSSVLDSWLVLVSTIPKPPNTLILRLVLAPAYLKVAHPSVADCWDPFRNHRNQPWKELKSPHKMSDLDREWKPKARPQSFVSLYCRRISE